MDKGEKLVEQALKEMFKRVGMTYPNKEFTDQPDWYAKRTWTAEEEKDFCSWLAKKVKKTWPYMNKRKVDFEVAMFNLCYGWKTYPHINELQRKRDKEGIKNQKNILKKKGL